MVVLEFHIFARRFAISCFFLHLFFGRTMWNPHHFHFGIESISRFRSAYMCNCVYFQTSATATAAAATLCNDKLMQFYFCSFHLDVMPQLNGSFSLPLSFVRRLDGYSSVLCCTALTECLMSNAMAFFFLVFFIAVAICYLFFECLACAHHSKLDLSLDCIFNRDKLVRTTSFQPTPFNFTNCKKKPDERSLLALLLLSCIHIG